VGWLFRFSFSFIHDSRSSFHFRVTFISVSIELALSARNACFATKIFPVILFGGCYSSCLRLLMDSDRGFCSTGEGRGGWLSCAMTVLEE
jgi:hypothetical protein